MYKHANDREKVREMERERLWIGLKHIATRLCSSFCQKEESTYTTFNLD